MAKRRMLSIPIVETDKFYRLTTASQAFYLHLNLNADDDGVVDKVSLIMSQMRLKRRSYQELVEEGYIIELDDGLVAITHWHQHNQIRKDRYVKGEYLDRLSNLSLQENGRFIKASSGILVDKRAPQDRTVEYSKVKDSAGEHRAEEKRKNNNNNNLSYIHSKVASLPDEENEYSFYVECDPTKVAPLCKRYLDKINRSDQFDEFLEYYRCYREKGRGYVVSSSNYKAFIDEWLGIEDE